VLQKILIATGDSPESAEVFKSGLTLAQKYGAQISILHVLNLFQTGFEAVSNPFMGGTYPMMNDLAIQEYQKELQDREQQGMERLESYETEARARNIQAEIYQNIGDAGRTICETAKPEVLIDRLSALFPDHSHNIRRFVNEVEKTGAGLKILAPPIDPVELLKHPSEVWNTVWNINSTLQDVFDKFQLPQAAQTLLALQWLDFLLPPNQLSFFAWVALFRGYQAGAFYPTQHFEDVINSLVKVIESNGGQVLLTHEVTNFRLTDKTVTGVEAMNLTTHQTAEFTGGTVICNIDPQRAAKTIGLDKFSITVRRKLDYEYSASNYMVYCVVKDIDLRDYGFGKWNVSHTGHESLNEAFAQMYDRCDYSNPSFAITTPTLLTDASRDCPADCQIVEFLTVANYAYFKQLRDEDPKAYRQKKQEILDAILDVVEKHYVPNFREHMVFEITGSPTTNERYCWCPEGNSYGSILTPRNMGLGRLNHQTSLERFYFCNASSGYPGFAPTIWTGALLYQRLSGDAILGD
jgi:all-trans-retinol 13,14-reductase